MSAAGGPRVLVAGALANKSGNGGEAWVRLSWIHALEELGAEVAFVERLAAHHPDGDAAQRWFIGVTQRFDLAGRSWLVDAAADRAGGGTVETGAVLVGDGATLAAWVATADILVDISGNLTGWAPAEAIATRIHVDLDPGYTQVWAETAMLDLSWHQVHATVGVAIGTPVCPFPTAGVSWIGIRPPVCLDDWLATPIRPVVESGTGRFTTVSSWRGPFGPLHWDGLTFGVKAHSFRALAGVAAAAPAPLELAVQIDPADEGDAAALRARGWSVRPAADVAGTPEAFADYIAGSLGELSIAHPLYVGGRTGWFSDRTVRYLASARPAIVEDTGWTSDLPSGCGLIGFSEPEEALAALERVMCDPQRHSDAARAVAAEHFSPRSALGPLLDAVGWQP